MAVPISFVGFKGLLGSNNWTLHLFAFELSLIRPMKSCIKDSYDKRGKQLLNFYVDI